MITEVSTVNFRESLGDMLDQVQHSNDGIVITEDGKPVAALINAEMFARIQRKLERFDEISAYIARRYADVPPEEGMAEIDALVAEERKKAR
jgi:prevent-host-death family protein